jgi:DNA-binding phage protein
MEADMTPTIDEERLKNLFKAAIVEVFEERRDLVRDVVDEALEDIALARAIDEGARGANVSREEVFDALEEGR